MPQFSPQVRNASIPDAQGSCDKATCPLSSMFVMSLSCNDTAAHRVANQVVPKQPHAHMSSLVGLSCLFPSLVRHQTILPVLSVTFQTHSWALRVTQRNIYISVQTSGTPEAGSTSLIFLTIDVLPLCCCKHLIWIRISHSVLHMISS